MPDLEMLAGSAPEPLPEEPGDSHDPRPWLQACDAGFGSPLELEFLRLFEQYGIEVEKQVPLGRSPAVQRSARRTCVVGSSVLVYVDGAAFHTGNRLRRDRRIREALRTGTSGWQVVEVTARDLATPARTAERIRTLVAEARS